MHMQNKLHNIPLHRLQNQYLIGDSLETSADFVEWLGAVQSQDFAGAKWGVGLRLQNKNDSDVEDAFNKGDILRTHVLRPTWHFVTPKNIRWMLHLSVPSVKKLLGHYDKKLGIDAEVIKKSQKIISDFLKNNNYSTRDDLKKQFVKNNIPFDNDSLKVQKLAHLVMHAELDGLICSGPRKEKQFTYALIEERVPIVKDISHDEALATLALKYIQSHGPVQVRDFKWWGGLSSKDAQEGISMIHSQLEQEIINEKTYYFVKNQIVKEYKKPKVLLLSIYDEYTIAYNDRSDLGNDPRYIEKMISMGNLLTAVVILDGRVAGTWKREVRKDSVIIKLNLFTSFTTEQQKALHAEAEKYGKFLGLPSKVEGV